jgi:transcriptional regulator
MYQPRVHEVDDLARQHEFVRANPLGLLVTNGPGGLMANPLPFHLDETAGPFGALRVHVARANPQWREADGERRALVVFQDPGVYVTPSWYATKRETGKVVPTWNYVCVQARGSLRVVDDPAWLRRQLDALTASREAARETPWTVDDAPADYVEQMMNAVIGLEMTIESIEGKWKVSQNRVAADRAGVVDGLRAEADDASSRMADLVERATRC